MADSPTPTSRFDFPRRMRLSGRRQFAAVYGAKTRASAGPLLVYGLPNDLALARLGLAVARRVGTNVVRNTIKRRLREAFRQMQHEAEFAAGYDLVISVRPHEPLSVVEYQTALREAVGNLHITWSKRRDKPLTRKKNE